MSAPRGMSSLLEMLKKYSTIFGTLMVNLYDCEMRLYSYSIESPEQRNRPIDDSEHAAIEHNLTIATNMAIELGLDAAAVLIDRMWKELKSDYTVAIAYRDISDLKSRIEDQLAAQLVLMEAETCDAHDAPMGEPDQFRPLLIERINDVGDVEQPVRCLVTFEGEPLTAVVAGPSNRVASPPCCGQCGFAVWHRRTRGDPCHCQELPGLRS